MINLMIVDDSAFMRKVLHDALTLPDIQVSAVARQGQHALQLLEKEVVDLILLDVEMPIMNGLEALAKIKEQYDIPVIMVSSTDAQRMTIEALALGASDFVEKPTNLLNFSSRWIDELADKIRSLVTKPMVHVSAEVNRHIPKQLVIPKRPQALVIGASTGGPRAILQIIQALPEKIRIPIFIVQHMPKGFTTSFAQRLNTETSVNVKEAEHLEKIQPIIYLCPGDYHLTIQRDRLLLDQEAKKHGTRPAVDYLFNSASKVYQEQLHAFLLTGMGKDGALGMEAIKAENGYTYAQDKESCVVFGMPRVAIERQVVDEVLSLTQIAQKISELAR